MSEGHPHTGFWILRPGGCGHVCNVVSTLLALKSIKGTLPKKPACCFLLRTPPSTINSAPFHSVLVNPAVALAPCLLPKSNGVSVPLRAVTSSLTPVEGLTVLPPGNPSS